jgi:hypothetical protein
VDARNSVCRAGVGKTRIVADGVTDSRVHLPKFKLDDEGQQESDAPNASKG